MRKKVLSLIVAITILLSLLPVGILNVSALSPTYAASSSYKSGSYYSALCNVTLTGNQRQDIVNVALSQVGYREGSYQDDYSGAADGSYNNYTEYNYWYNKYVSSGMPVGGSGAPWCATFVSWCAEQANVPTSILKRSTAAGHGANYFNINFYSGSSTLASSADNDAYFKGYNYTPKVGDLFFTRSWSHVGIVVAVNGSYVTTVEGNTNTNGSSQGNGVYKLTWRKITDLYFGVPNYQTGSTSQKTIDERYASFLPIGTYTLSTGRISVYDETGTLYSNRYIDGATDLCAILEIYTDGWCKVRYPSSAESSGYFNAYVPLSTFTNCTAPSSWTATGDYTTYKRSDLGSTMYSVSNGASCLLLQTEGSLRQIIHPVSGQSYSMMGWINDPKQIHVSTSSVSLMLGGTESNVMYAWSTGSYDGTTSLYYSRNNDNISCSWGDWENGKAPLTISALKKGTTILTIGVKDYDTGAVLDSTTVSVTVDAKSYTVSYNANGGSGAPSSQTKYHNTTLTLSSTKPVRTGYTFQGWSTSSSASSASYKPGGSFTANANTTLYAVWQKGCENNTHSYSYKVSKAPTATSTGTLTGTCSKCSNTSSVTLPKLNTTDYTYSITKAATCTATGTGRYTWKTTTYGNFYFDVSIAATGHSYSYKATKAPTTSATGTLTGTCTKCSGTTTVALPKLNTTDYSYSIIKAATCTAAGTGRYTWKTTTYGSFYFDVSLAALGHRWDNGVVIKEPTEESEGERKYTCTQCGSTKTEKIPPLDHEHHYEAVITAPTCTEMGYTTYVCDCGDSIVTEYTASLGHDFGGWITIQEPTYQEEGVEIRACGRCAFVEYRAVPRLENPFADVPEGSFYYDPVMWAVENGITNGTTPTTFGPNDQCMRAHVVTFLWRAMGSPEPKLLVNPFVDVKPMDFYYKPVLWALEKGITSGLDATHFGPTSYCNRAQVVTFLYRTMGSPAMESMENPFTDVQTGAFYEKPVLWAVKNGITNGLSATSFGPTAICNRAQIVTFLYRAFATA